jgi:branched-chain amino acid transport system permease protein
MKKILSAKSGATCLFLLIAVIFPHMGVSTYYLHLVTLSLIWVIMTEGLNVIQGLTGYVSIAQASFFGIGAYASSLLVLRAGLPFWGALPVVLLIAAVAGLIVGYPSLRTQGHYFAIITLAFCTVLWLLMMTLHDVTGGEEGISKIPPPESIFGIDFSNKTNFYYLILFVALITIFFVYRLKNSKTGRAFVTIRENEQLAQAVGISLVKYKTMAFVISAVFGGLAGAFFAPYMKFINPTTFGDAYSMNAILAIIMGGSGTIAGPVIGSFLMNFLPEYLRVVESMRMVIYGLMLILITIFLPRGIMGVISSLSGRIGASVRKRTPAGKEVG